MAENFLLLQERVKNTIQLGESHFREFKTALEGSPGNKKPRRTKHICQDIGEALVAFANADGGELLIGVEDDGHISGIVHSLADIEQMLKAIKTHVFADTHLPIIIATKIEIENKLILFFSVAKGTTEIYQLPDGRCMRRQDKSTVPVTFKQISFQRQEIKSREYDRQFIDGATVNDLDLPFIQTIADAYLNGLSVEGYLQQSGLAEYAINGLRLRMAALLLFAKDIQPWHPRSQIRILKVLGTELKSGEAYNVSSDEFVYGNIFQLLEKSWKMLRPFLAYKTEFDNSAKFEQKYIYPEAVCREALINAIVHRDYSIYNGIDIFIFENRMEIKSPGALLSTINIKTLKQLQGAHESRNALIARVLRENNYMRGEGMKRMFTLMKDSELEMPKLFSNSIWFSITFPHKSIK
ncbi:MAG: ATP-binding protein [Pseudomonadota bacterium]